MASLPHVLTPGSAAALGLRTRQLQRLEYRHPARGVYVADWLDPSDPALRFAVAAELATARTTIGGWAAARVHEERARTADDDVRVFDGRATFDGPGCLAPTLLLIPPESRIAVREGFVVLRSRVPDDEREPYGQAAITTPLRTAFDLARLLPRAGAVVALDRLLSLGLVGAGDLHRLLTQRRRWRGVAGARRSLALADDHVRSPMESRMRLEWLASGLPRPLCNAVVEAADGRFVAMVDLLDEATGLVGEYDGGHHASAEQRRADAVRRDAAVAVGLTPVAMTSADLRSEARLAEWRRRLTHQWRIAARQHGSWRVRRQAA